MAGKSYDPVAHTTEHILSRVMIMRCGSGRPVGMHLERKKSKSDYEVDHQPTKDELQAIEKLVNDTIKQDLEVKIYRVPPAEAHPMVDISKLPARALDEETIRIVQIGEFDYTACIGAHVARTSEIPGTFRINSSTFENGVVRLRWNIK
jgi:Ser-tRNA(Ala) deacylase AlaX